MKQKIIIFFLLSCIISIYTSIEVKASERFYEAEYISKMWVNKEKNGKIRYQQARFLRRSSDNKFAYCIEPWEVISNSVNYENTIDANNLDSEVLEKLTNIAYYGYGYKNHTDIKWYYITQILIWRVADPSAVFYFTDKLSGNITYDYQSELNELEDLVNKHQVKPNFGRQNFKVLLGDTITLTDSNHVLDQFDIIGQDNLEINKTGNNLVIKAIKETNTLLNFKKTDTQYSIPAIVYLSNTHQDLMTVGSFKPINHSIDINIFSGSIEIKKIDMDTKSSIPLGEASLNGSKFKIYNENMEVVESFTIEQNSPHKIYNLKKGTYILKEIEAGEGYLINDLQKEFTIDETNNNISIIFENQVIKKKIKIQKYYGTEKNWLTEEKIQFDIKDKYGNTIESVITNEYGIAEVVLPYGTYTVTQKNSKDHYEKVDDFTIAVTKEDDQLYYKKYNYEISGELIIKKIDSSTKELITKPTYFKIQNLENGEWLDRIYQTDESGTINIKNLYCGKYKIVELSAPDGYIKTNEKFLVEITKRGDSVTIVVENERKIEVPNTSVEKEYKSNCWKVIKIEKNMYMLPNRYFN